MIARLGLIWSSVSQATLADGSEIDCHIYQAVAVWDGHQRRIEVDAADSTALVGMAMLEGHELNVQVRPRGRVTIKRLGDPPTGRRRR